MSEISVDDFIRRLRSPRRRAQPRLAACLRHVEQHDIPDAQGNVAAWRLGAGPAVLLVHGWEDDHSVWTPLIDALISVGFAIVTLDLPAHGWSDGEWGMRGDCIDAVLATARALGPVDMAVGHSMGCAVLATAIAEGLDIDRFVLIAAGLGRSDRWSYAAERMGLAPEIAEGARARYIAEVGEMRGGADAAEVLAGLRCRKFLVHSYDDEAAPLSRAQAAAELSGAPLLAVAGLDHRQTAQDAGVIEQVVEFLTQP